MRKFLRDTLGFFLASQMACSLPELAQHSIRAAYDRPSNSDVNSSSPIRIVIITSGLEGPLQEVGISIAFPYSRVLPNHDVTKNQLLKSIDEYVSANGTLNEVVIAAEGAPNAFSATGRTDDAINVKSFLNGVAALQDKLGRKISDRFVFTGCNIFTNLTRDDISEYKKLARSLNAQIVAPTAYYIGAHYQSGRMAVFFPNGVVARDKLDMPFDIMSLFGTLKAKALGYSSSWLDVAQHTASPSRTNIVTLIKRTPIRSTGFIRATSNVNSRSIL